jgi:hypothetical protein
MGSDQNQTLPPQVQDQQPGHETEMNPQPDYEPRYPSSNRLQGKVALITGGDSGIGRATAVLFAREGADLAIMYLNENEDAQKTKHLVEREGRSCLTIAGDVGEPGFCRSAVDQVIQQFGQLDVLVNNAAEPHPKKEIEEIHPIRSTAPSAPTSSAISTWCRGRGLTSRRALSSSTPRRSPPIAAVRSCSTTAPPKAQS